MCRKFVLILILLIFLMSGCQHLMPDQLSISAFEGPMGQRVYVPGLIWNIPQLNDGKNYVPPPEQTP